MPRSTYPFIAKEGWLILFILGVVTVYAQINLDGSITAILLTLLFIFSYLIRDPKPSIPTRPLAILSPVDGKVISIEAVQDPFLARRAIRICLQMKWWNIYSLRNVIEGKVQNQWFKSSNKSNGRVAQFAWWVQTDEGDDVLTAVVVNKHPGRFRFYIQSGERLGHGHRCGFLFFGTTVEVFVPKNSRVFVELNQSLRSGQDMLAEFIHTEAVSAI